jgi:peptide deformylase
MTAKYKIITLPHKDLRRRSKKVAHVTPHTLALIDEMQQCLIDWETSRNHEVGVALAAVQIDKLLSVIIIRNNFDDKKDHSITAIINPEIVEKSGPIINDHEGCLSVLDVYGMIPRHSKVKVRGLDINGKKIIVEAEGFVARILQHEIDHTNGIVIVDHIRDNPEAFYELVKDGGLKQIDYESKIKSNSLLW